MSLNLVYSVASGAMDSGFWWFEGFWKKVYSRTQEGSLLPRFECVDRKKKNVQPKAWKLCCWDFFIRVLFFLFFWRGWVPPPHLWPGHAEILEPGIKPMVQQWLEPQQWQCWILNLLSQQGTPKNCVLFGRHSEDFKPLEAASQIALKNSSKEVRRIYLVYSSFLQQRLDS